MRPNAIRCQTCQELFLEEVLAAPLEEGEPPPPCLLCPDGGAPELVEVTICRTPDCDSPYHAPLAALHVMAVTT